MSQSVNYVGLDVHKNTIVVAVAKDGKRVEVCEHGEIANTPTALAKVLGKLGGRGVALHVCYEAGPCGYGIQRQVTAAGHRCAVVAPSLIPRRPGDWIKEVRDLQTAIGLVAADAGVTIVPASVQRLQRDDIVYRPIADSNATSPIVMSHRQGDVSTELALLVEISCTLYGIDPSTGRKVPDGRARAGPAQEVGAREAQATASECRLKG